MIERTATAAHPDATSDDRPSGHTPFDDTATGDTPPARPLSRAAAAVLTSEIRRLPGPRTVLLAGAGPTVAERVLDALTPADRLVVWAPDALDAVRLRLAIRDGWPALDAVTSVVDTLPTPSDQSQPVDVAVVARPVLDDALVEPIRALLGPDGVLSLAAPARPSGDPLALTAAAYAVRTDLVLRTLPPVRVHHLRFGPPRIALAARLTPARTPSHVPLTRSMGLDSNGVAASALLGGAALLTRVARPRSRAWLVPALAAIPVAAFFRDPERTVPEDPRAVVAASDGVVLAVEELTDERLGDRPWLRVSVFLSVLDVHVNRSPVAGRVVDVVRETGGYAMAQTPGAEHNVACYTVLETDRGRVVVAQRTGLVARRIVNRAKVGAPLAKGERYGLIRFGSRTDVYLPAGLADPLVAPADRVVGGETVLARWL